MTSSEYSLNRSELVDLYQRKYTRYGEPGWGPKSRLKHDYFTPDDYYEALVSHLLRPGDAWCDVGCGRDIFPGFPELASELAARAGYVYGVDPDNNVQENAFLNDRFQGVVEDCPTQRQFDLLTMRMVAEHVADPPRALGRIAHLLKPGGRLVIYTPHKWAPMSVVANTFPFALHHPFKRVLWNTEARDTFPTQYKMNTRRDLLRHCASVGLREAHYERLDDCRTTSGFRTLNAIELRIRSVSRAIGLAYPEACILAVYEKPRT